MGEDLMINVQCKLINEECVICLEDLTQNIVLLSCKHEYHYDCIQRWFLKKKYLECPLCCRRVEIINIMYSTMGKVPLLIPESREFSMKIKCCVIL